MTGKGVTVPDRAGQIARFAVIPFVCVTRVGSESKLAASSLKPSH